jgi:hypothetical protein
MNGRGGRASELLMGDRTDQRGETGLGRSGKTRRSREVPQVGQNGVAFGQDPGRLAVVDLGLGGQPLTL